MGKCTLWRIALESVLAGLDAGLLLAVAVKPAEDEFRLGLDFGELAFGLDMAMSESVPSRTFLVELYGVPVQNRLKQRA